MLPKGRGPHAGRGTLQGARSGAGPRGGAQQARDDQPLRQVEAGQHPQRSQGQGLDEDQLLLLEPMLTDSLLQQLLEQMETIGVLRRDERGEWLLARDLDSISLHQLYESSQLRIPVAEEYLPMREDSLGQAACSALDQLRLPLRELLKRRVDDIYVERGDSR